MHKNEITTSRGKRVKNPELHDFLAIWLHRLSGSVLAKFERKLREQDMTSAQWVILCTIFQGSANTPQAIAEYIGVDGGSVSRSIDRLVAKGMLKKVPNSEDGRSITLALTQKEEPIIESLMHISCGQEMEWRSALNAEELKQYVELTAKLLQHQNVTLGGRIW